MRDLNAKYDIIGNDGIKIGEVVKGVIYDNGDRPVSGQLEEKGVYSDEGDLVACWEDERHSVIAPAYLSPAK